MQIFYSFIKVRRINALLIILNLLMILFIFSRSLMNADISSEESGFVMDIINKFFPFKLSEHEIRKIAHFSEFFVLGFINSFTVYSFSRTSKRVTFTKLFICLFTAVLDEFLQLSSEGRSGQVTDILIDFSGSVTGIIVSMIIISIYTFMKYIKFFKRELDIYGKHQSK